MEVEDQIGLDVVKDFIQKQLDGWNSRLTLQAVYLFGSRMHNLQTPSSDWDFLCIVDGEYYPGPKLFEVGNLNTNLFHRQYFQLLLDENVIWVVMTQFLPKRCVWLDEAGMTFRLRKNCLKKVVLMDANHNWMKAKRLWKEGDKNKSKKNIVHGLRYLDYALQLIQEGTISNFEAPNIYWHQISENPTDNWMDFEEFYKPIFTQKMQLLSHLCKPMEIPKKLLNPMGTFKLKTQLFIEKYGLEALSRELCIYIRPMRGTDGNETSVVGLLADALNSPIDNDITCECRGLVIDLKTDQVLCYPYKRFFNLEEKEAAKIDWKNCKISEKIDGTLAVLYFHQDAWCLASLESPNADDQIVTQLSHDRFYYFSKRPCYNAWKFFDDEMLIEKQGCAFLEGDDIPSGNLNTQERVTFRDVFWEIWESKGYRMPSTSHRMAFMFEMSSERQKLIIARGKEASGPAKNRNSINRLVLHGVRNMENFQVGINLKFKLKLMLEFKLKFKL
eukprot:TRINITY_DN6383_c0_g1_i4.p1 TRINITY_DN6383_c0_g1~~TRINITY_DN6383_c0_g1_i4.p1  ORF type:complete len:501 (+),score=162.43 TRINITY_DN6383_c0_g1_i4:56-1558(+)